VHPRARVVAGALCAAAACAAGQPLDRASLADAERRWHGRNLSDYRLHLSIEGDRIDAGDFTVEVRGGAVTSVERNGAPVDTRDAFYTVGGLFDFLRDELDMSASPDRFWGVPAGTMVRQRAHFHPEDGYPLRYLRSVSGTQHNIAIVVKSLEAVK
jgi:hypothetical protein